MTVFQCIKPYPNHHSDIQLNIVILPFHSNDFWIQCIYGFRFLIAVAAPAVFHSVMIGHFHPFQYDTVHFLFEKEEEERGNSYLNERCA